MDVAVPQAHGVRIRSEGRKSRPGVGLGPSSASRTPKGEDSLIGRKPGPPRSSPSSASTPRSEAQEKHEKVAEDDGVSQVREAGKAAALMVVHVLGADS